MPNKYDMWISRLYWATSQQRDGWSQVSYKNTICGCLIILVVTEIILPMNYCCFHYALLLLYVVIARFLYCTFIMYSAIRLSSCKWPINSVKSTRVNSLKKPRFILPSDWDNNLCKFNPVAVWWLVHWLRADEVRSVCKNFWFKPLTGCCHSSKCRPKWQGYKQFQYPKTLIPIPRYNLHAYGTAKTGLNRLVTLTMVAYG